MNEVENTARILADKPLLVTSRWCAFGIHNWTKWGKPQHRKEGGYEVDYQTRACDSCGELAIKVLRRY
jgi:hypothetical protein